MHRKIILKIIGSGSRSKAGFKSTVPSLEKVYNMSAICVQYFYKCLQNFYKMSTICREKANPSCFKMGINQSFSSTPMPQSLPIKRVPIVERCSRSNKRKENFKWEAKKCFDVVTSERIFSLGIYFLFFCGSQNFLMVKVEK